MIHPHISINQEKAGWLLAMAAALVINLILLSILPVVNLGSMSLPENPPIPQSVGFIRLAQTESLPSAPPSQRQETIPDPEMPAPQMTDAVDLSPDFLERTFHPELQAVSVQAALPRLNDIPMATIDFKATGLDGVFDVDELDQPLLAVSRPPPFYPLQARRASVEGWVEIEFIVNTQGRVNEVRIIDARPPGVFEESVRQAVSNWRFQPGTIMGEPVTSRVTTTVRFALEETP